jgi:hypothetical protein
VADASAPAVQASPAPTKTVLANVTVIDPVSGAKKLGNVVLDGDRIVAVVDKTPADAKVLDYSGKYVIPGLWDMHVHFTSPLSAGLFVANGVTSVRVMWGNPQMGPKPMKLHTAMKAAIEKGEVGPRMMIASNIMDGPHPIWPGSLALSTPDEGKKAVDDAKAGGADFIKVYSLLPRPVYFAIAEESKKQGITFEGHVPETINVGEASDAGQKSIEHLTGMVVACSGKEDALRKRQADFAKKDHKPEEWSKFKRDQTAEAVKTYDAKHADALFGKLAKNGTYQCPTFTVLKALSSFDDPKLMDDPRMQYEPEYMRKMWNPKTDFRTKAWTAADYTALRATLEKQLVIVGAMNKANVPILAGTDEVNPFCFPGFSLHDELGLLVKAGLTPTEALRAATWTPAKFFSQESTMGAVAEGKVADLVVLDADPTADIANTKKITAVVSRGVVHDRAALDKLLNDAKEAAAHPPAWGSGDGGGWTDGD